MTFFEELKKEVVSVFRQTHPHCNADMGQWKGQEIVDFQEELMSKVKGRISEKWFYTHIKSSSEKLPRIDMLNLLSEYAGFKNWNDFLGTKFPGQPLAEVPAAPASSVKANEQKKFPARALMSGIGIVLLFVFLFKLFSTPTYSYRCCFVDLDGITPVKSAVRITVLREGESPMYAESKPGGCLELTESVKKVQFVIASPYFRPDTFVRVLGRELTEERIRLRSDDYALMIHYFSTANIKDWKNRRAQLHGMIAENARIFQVYGNEVGMELFNKKQFIDKLTMPLKSLKNVEILEVQYENNKISELRFRQN